MKHITSSIKKDESHFVSVPQKSTILGSVQSWFRRLPMAKFYAGSKGGTHYKTVPMNKWIKIPIPKWLSGEDEDYIWTPPYSTGKQIKFKIIVTRFEALAPPLNQFDILETLPYPDSIKIDGKDIQERNIDRIKGLPNSATEFKVDMESKCHRAGAYFRYSLGKLGTGDQKLLAELKIISDDDVWLKLILPFVIPLITAILGFAAKNIISWICSFF